MRRLAIIFGWCVAGGLIALAALPWWLSAVARVVGAHYHATFTRYERIGYAHFALHDIVVDQATVHVTAERADTETPLLWFYHRMTGKPAVIHISKWRVEVNPRTTTPAAVASSVEGGALRTRTILFRVARGLERWAPLVEIGTGTVSWPGTTLEFAGARWNRRSLSVQSLRYGNQTVDVDTTFTLNDEILLNAKTSSSFPWSTALKNVGREITGEFKVWDQTASLAATLPDHGWTPTALDTEFKNWAIPAAKLKMGESYAMVRGHGFFKWKQGKFEASVDATGENVAGKKAPPIGAKLHARGDADSLVVDACQLDIPGATAHLSDAVTFSRTQRDAVRPSQFVVEIDFEKQPWFAGAKGHAAGKAQVIPSPTGFPLIEGSFSARDCVVGDVSIKQWTTTAALDWPRLQVKETTLDFAQSGKLSLHGGWNFTTHQVSEASVDGVIPSALVARWLPKNVGFDSLQLSAKATGPLEALQHEGNAHLKAFTWGKLKPLVVALVWRGTARDVEISTAQIEAGTSRIVATGTIRGESAQATTLKFFHDKDELLALVRPVRLRWAPTLEIDALELNGKNASLMVDLSKSAAGHFEIAARNLPSNWTADFLDVPGPEWRIASFETRGEWSEGPVQFSSEADIAMMLSPDRAANLTLAAKGERDGIAIQSLRVIEGTTPIVQASGRVPVTLHVGADHFIQLSEDAPLILHATTTSNPEFWSKLSEATGLEFQNPEVSAELSGTWSHPKGELSAKAARVAFDSSRVKFSLPLVEALDLHATADGKGIEVDQLSLQVEKQAVKASGHVDFSFEQWADLKKAPIAFLRRAGNAHLEIPQADVAALAKYLPAFLAPVGNVQIDATIKPGGEMSGMFRLRDAATRPLGPLGVLQEIQAEALLNGRTVEIKNLAARSGGQPVTLTGKIQLPVDGAPKYDLELKGNNLPLVRQTGLLLRADLDLKLITQSDNVPEVSGSVNLHDSMFLSDVRALIPRGGGGGPARRPPFFAIEMAPVNAWRFAVDVHGDKFLRLRSTVFVGVASAHFRLAGTLGEPRAIGEATVDNGQVLLPFAVFRVEQGTVRLTEADPYGLRLYLAGTSRRYGYDLRMELTGTAAEPILTFSSNPPLDAKQVLLMVTAGETPKDEVTYSGSQRVTRLGTYLGQSLINNFGGDSADADRLSISSGERVSRQGRETYDVEYRLSDRFSLVGEYDEFDDYNAGVKWRFLTPGDQVKKAPAKTGPPADAKEARDGPKP